VASVVVYHPRRVVFDLSGWAAGGSASTAVPPACPPRVRLLFVPPCGAGNLFTILVIGSISPLLTQVQEFLFFAAMCTLATFLLLWVGKGFTYVESYDEVAGEGPGGEPEALTHMP